MHPNRQLHPILLGVQELESHRHLQAGNAEFFWGFCLVIVSGLAQEHEELELLTLRELVRLTKNATMHSLMKGAQCFAHHREHGDINI